MVVTKEGKLLTDEGDEQVSVRLIAIFSRLVLLILIFVFVFHNKSKVRYMKELRDEGGT